uniref:Uncharacterized protein n=1 Tax=Anguilla anguilla TaxID=7936 RepID=A0A0E9RU63_ANGAN
MLNHLAQFKKN